MGRGSFDDGMFDSVDGGSGYDGSSVDDSRQTGKLDEKEVISLLRTLYLKSGQPAGTDLRDDYEERGQKSGSRSGSRGRGRSSNRSGSRGRSRDGGGSRGRGGGGSRGNSRHRRSSSRRRSRSPGRSKGGGLFGRSVDGNKSRTSRGILPSIFGGGGGGKRGSSGKHNSHKHNSKHRRGRSRDNYNYEDRDDSGTKPSKIHVGGVQPNGSFEYLNEANPYGPALAGHQHPHMGAVLQPPLTPQEEHYLRQTGRLPPGTRGVPVGGLPPTLQELRSRPGFVEGEVLLQAEPVQAITTTNSNGRLNAGQRARSPSSPRGPHNTVQGQHVGPPRINTLRGTARSPIVTANELHDNSVHPHAGRSGTGTTASAITPKVGNRTGGGALDTALNLLGDDPTGNGDKYDPTATKDDVAKALADPSLNNGAVPPAAAGAAAAAATAGGMTSRPTSLPTQILIEQKHPQQRHYVTWRDQPSLVSDVSSSHRGRGGGGGQGEDMWTRSPNSVMSQWMHDLEPNRHCCIRGTSWYDALHYACSRMLCDAEPAPGRLWGKQRSRSSSPSKKQHRGHNDSFEQDDVDYYWQTNERGVSKRTRKPPTTSSAMQKFFVPYDPTPLTTTHHVDNIAKAAVPPVAPNTGLAPTTTSPAAAVDTTPPGGTQIVLTAGEAGGVVVME